jgi:hypothetical protein
MAVGRVGDRWDPSEDGQTSLEVILGVPVSIQDFSCIDTRVPIWEQNVWVSIQDFSCIDTEGLKWAV